jgi:hypothetical protein
MRGMRIAPVPPPPVAVALATACALLMAACVPRPATLASPSSAVATTSIAASGAGAAASAGPLGPAPTPSFVRPTPGPGPTFLAYAVKGRDTLTSIARTFHTTPRSIAFWSRAEHPSLDPESAAYQPNHLEIGWILLLIPDSVFDEDQLIDATATPSPS